MAIPRWKLYFAVGVGTISLWPGLAGQNGATVPTPPLDAAEQEKLLESMRSYAERYVSNLPNFMCLQITRQFEADPKPKHWHRGDTLVSKLVFNRGREERTLQLVNGKPAVPAIRRWRTPLTTEGEFGILLGSIFASLNNLEFVWKGWEVVREKRVAVFDYSIDRAKSTLKLSLGDRAQAILAYRGSIYADAATGAIWRLTASAFDIPPEVETRSISRAIDYAEVPIAGVDYLLPVEATVLLTADDANIRNEIEFTNYRKFEADSKITYSTDGNTTDVQAGNAGNSPAPP